MSKEFYRDIKLIISCKNCGVEYRPARFSFFASLKLCWKCRRIYYRNWYINKFLPWFMKQPKEVQDKYRKMRYDAWLKWVEKNADKRRKQALESYHRRKLDPKNRARKHVKINLPLSR